MSYVTLTLTSNVDDDTYLIALKGLKTTLKDPNQYFSPQTH